MEILFEKEVIQYLDIPSIPRKRHDNISSFKYGVAVLTLISGQRAYAICSFDKDVDDEPRIVKVFGVEPYKSVDEIFVVPSYMDCDANDADLDDVSKKRAAQLVEEAREIENEGVEETTTAMDKLPEWIFPEIESREQAEAWLRRYNSMNKIKGKLPQSEETIKLRLYSIYTELQNKGK